MSTTSQKEFLFRIPKKLYNKDLQIMMDYLRYKKATQKSKASRLSIEKLVNEVRKIRKEVHQASRFL